MLPSFPYMGMLITGVLHAVLGFAILVCSSIGLNTRSGTFLNIEYNHPFSSPVTNTYLGCALAASLWIIMVGVLGILTGIKYTNTGRTQGLKIAYMVTAILSAVIFCQVGLILSALAATFTFYKTVGLVGGICSFADFILSIVSSSICCCCSQTTTPTTGVVFVQNQAPPGNYPPGIYPTGNYPPGTYPPATVQYPAPQNLQSGVSNPGYPASAQ